MGVIVILFLYVSCVSNVCAKVGQTSYKPVSLSPCVNCNTTIDNFFSISHNSVQSLASPIEHQTPIGCSLYTLYIAKDYRKTWI